MSPTRKQILERFGGDEEKMREHYRQMQRKSREKYSGKGGFTSMTKERRREVALLGVKARLRSKNVTRNTEHTDDI